MAALAQPLRLPCGAVLKNRIGKSAMTEGLADPLGRATVHHEALYTQWSTGCGLLVTGNFQIDRRFLERPGNVCIDGPQDSEQRRRLAAFASAATLGGNHCWAQIGHAGRQCSTLVNTAPCGPSAVPVRVTTRKVYPTRALAASEIKKLIVKFGDAARVCKECGFTGVQLHAAHGYLLSSFLSPLANKRCDAYGSGSLKDRARFLLECVASVRAAVGHSFPIGVKLNSADFQRGGFSHADAIAVAVMLDQAGIDLLEISGGNYENPVLIMGTGDSTNLREAYFMRYAKDIKNAMTRTPLMVTGGFRTKVAMCRALGDGECDLIGVARPLCGMPTCVDDLLDGKIEALPSWEVLLTLPWPLEKLSAVVPFVQLGKQALTVQPWCYHQILRMGDGLKPDPHGKTLIECARRISANEMKTAAALRGIDCAGTVYNNQVHALPLVSSAGGTAALLLATGVAGAIWWRSRL